MIDSHVLAFAGVLMVYLAGATMVALAVVVLACTVLAAAITLRVITGLTRAVVRLTRRVRKRKSRQHSPALPLSMEEALAQVATGKTMVVQGKPWPFNAWRRMQEQ